MAAMKSYFEVKLNEVEQRNRELEHEIYNMKQNGASGGGVTFAELEAAMAALQNKLNQTIEVASEQIGGLKKELNDEKAYSSHLKSTIANLKQAESHKNTQMGSAKKTASDKYKSATAKIDDLQKKLDEKSERVVHFSTQWKRSKAECDILRSMLASKGLGDPYALPPTKTTSKRKWGDLNNKPATPLKKAAYTDTYMPSDEDDDEPLMNQYRKPITRGMKQIKLESNE